MQANGFGVLFRKAFPNQFESNNSVLWISNAEAFDFTRALTLMQVSGLRQVCDAGVRAHQHVGWMEGAFQEATTSFAQVNSAERRLGQVVGWHQRQAVDSDLVDGIDGLEDSGHPLE